MADWQQLHDLLNDIVTSVLSRDWAALQLVVSFAVAAAAEVAAISAAAEAAAAASVEAAVVAESAEAAVTVASAASAVVEVQAVVAVGSVVVAAAAGSVVAVVAAALIAVDEAATDAERAAAAVPTKIEILRLAEKLQWDYVKLVLLERIWKIFLCL